MPGQVIGPVARHPAATLAPERPPDQADQPDVLLRRRGLHLRAHQRQQARQIPAALITGPRRSGGPCTRPCLNQRPVLPPCHVAVLADCRTSDFGATRTGGDYFLLLCWRHRPSPKVRETRQPRRQMGTEPARSTGSGRWFVQHRRPAARDAPTYPRCSLSVYNHSRQGLALHHNCMVLLESRAFQAVAPSRQ